MIGCFQLFFDDAADSGSWLRSSSAPGESASGESRAALRVSILPRRVKPGMEVQARVAARIPDEQLRFAWRVGHGAYVAGTSRFEVPADAGRTQLSVRVEQVGGPSDSGAVEASVVVGNRPPALGSVALTPKGELRVGETLRVAASATDPDGDHVRLEYGWLVNGRRLRHAGRALPADRLAVGDRVEVEVWASDGVERSPRVRVGPVVRVNSLPEITSRPPTSLGRQAFEYRVRAQDADDSRRLRFRLLEAPAGTSLDPLSGRLSWDPGQAQPGRHVVLVAVEDWIGGQTTQRFEVVVGVDPVSTGLPMAQAE